MRFTLCLITALAVLAVQPALAKTKQRPAEAPVVSDAPSIVAEGAPAGTYFAPAIHTNSASLAYHAGTGLHAAYAGFGNQKGDAMMYARCVVADCTGPDAWRVVELPLPQAVKVQLALTPSGQPRLLGAGWSEGGANATDYVYAECDSNCLDRASWTLGTIMSTADGIMSNISRSRLPERSFALDEAGRPRFIVSDANYLVEPDHYGAFYMACDRDCTRARNWTETNLANQSGYVFESFSYPVLALAPGGKARMIASVYAFDENGTDLEDGLYYYECDRNCSTRANWSRTRVIERGSGSYPDPTWDLKTAADGTPRLAFFAGDGMTDAGLSRQLIYAWCETDCTAPEGANWFGYPLGLGEGVGEGPSLALDGDGAVHMAFVTGGLDLGYATCTSDCENPDGAPWDARLAEAEGAAASARPTALPYTCDGEVWNAMAPSLTLVGRHPLIGYDISVEARCLYKEFGRPEVTYQFHEIWRGARLIRP